MITITRYKINKKRWAGIKTSLAISNQNFIQTHLEQKLEP